MKVFNLEVRDYVIGLMLLGIIALGLKSVGMFDQTVNTNNKGKVAVSDAGAPKIRVQQVGDHYIDWGDEAQGRPHFVLNGLKPFGKDKSVLLGFMSNGSVMYQLVDPPKRTEADALKESQDLLKAMGGAKGAAKDSESK